MSNRGGVFRDAAIAWFTFSLLVPLEYGPLITLTRLLRRPLASVLRRALDLSSQAFAPFPIRCSAGPEGLVIRAANAEFAVEYRDPQPRAPATIVVPGLALRTLADRKAELVMLAEEAEPGGAPQIVARWREAAIPQLARWPVPAADQMFPFPDTPSSWTENRAALGEALQQAYEVTDPDSSRYALGCLQLRGRAGAIAATDGRQILVQSGFELGFDDDLLVRPNGVFRAPLLAEAMPVLLGRGERHLALRSGAWTCWWPIQTQGRYPRIDDVLPTAEQAQATVELHPADAAFLGEKLAHLPGQAEPSAPVTLDVNGRVLVRAADAESRLATELQLVNSSKRGADLRLVTDRRFLARALRLGLTRWHLQDQERPILAQDATRRYVWAVLAQQDALPPSAEAVVVPAPRAAPGPARNTSRKPRKRPMRKVRPVLATPEEPPVIPIPLTSNATKPVGSAARAGARSGSRPSLREQGLQLQSALR